MRTMCEIHVRSFATGETTAVSQYDRVCLPYADTPIFKVSITSLLINGQ